MRALVLSGIYWDDAWQRQQQFTKYLVLAGYEVYFIEHIVSSKFSVDLLLDVIERKKTEESSNNIRYDNLHIVSDRFVNPQRGFFELFNHITVSRILKKIPNSFDVVLNYLPIKTTELILSKISYDTLIYDCVRNFTEWTSNTYPKNIETIENKLCKKANIIFTDSYFLTDKMNKKCSFNKKVIQFLPIANSEWKKGIIEKNVLEIKNVGYFGTISELQNDYSVYKSLTENGMIVHLWGKMPKNLPFEYVDHGYINNLEYLANDIIKHCDALVIAYKGNMDGVIPAKLMQAISTGLPVYISSFYDSRKLKKHIFVFENTEELISKIKAYDIANYSIIKDENVKYLRGKDEETQYNQFVSALRSE